MQPESQDPAKDPRAAQKSRTRAALLQAARQISADGGVLTVMAAADRAGISKATAYRYFTDPGTLAYEAALDLAVLTPEQIVGDSADVRERAQRTALYFRDFPRRHEAAFRQFFARTMDNWAGGQGAQIRGARRIPAFDLALSPVRGQIDPERYHLLLIALSSSATGFEQHIAMTDVCGLSPAQADALGVQVVDAILNHFLP
jgi:AcrR family transcriptional regulator